MFNDFDSSAYIVQSTNTLDVSYAIQLIETFVDALSSVIVQVKNDLSSTGVVGIRTSYDIPSNVTILQNKELNSNSYVPYINELDSITRIQATKVFETNSYARILKPYDIPSNTFIPFFEFLDSLGAVGESNYMDVSYLIRCIENNLDTLSSAVIYYKNDLEATARVRTWKDTDFNSTATITHFMDYLSKVFIPISNELDSTLNVSASLLMDVIFSAILPPPHYENDYVVKDSYIRDSRPTLNYGTAQTLVVGNGLDGVYRILMELDLTNLRNRLTSGDSYVTSAELMLDFVNNYDSNVLIEAYEINTAWLENSVTWGNFTETLTTPIFTFNPTDKLKLNILTYLKDLISRGKNTANLLFKVKNEGFDTLSYISSKEVTDVSSRPSLLISYQDLNWNGNIESSDVTSTVSIKAGQSRDMFSAMRVRAKKDFDFSSTVDINVPGIRDNMGTGKIRRSDLTELNNQANIYIKSEITSSAIIRHSDTKDLNNEADIVYSTDLDSTITVSGYFNLLDSNAIIRNLGSNNLFSLLDIWIKQDLESQATSGRFTNSDLTSLGRIRRRLYNELDGKADIWIKNDIDSNSIIRLTKQSDLTSKATPRPASYLDSTIVVQTSLAWLDGKSKIRLSNELMLDSSAYLLPKSDLDGNFTIRQNAVFDRDGKLKIRRTELIDIDSSAILRQSGHADIDNTGVLKANGQLEMLMKSIIRRYGLSDLDWNTIIRQFDIEEISSSSFLIGATITDIDFHATIKRAMMEFLDSEALINTSARQWIPNLHGKDVFKFNDRKLPRLWIRDKFIP